MDVENFAGCGVEDLNRHGINRTVQQFIATAQCWDVNGERFVEIITHADVGRTAFRSHCPVVLDGGHNDHILDKVAVVQETEINNFARAWHHTYVGDGVDVDAVLLADVGNDVSREVQPRRSV